MTRGTCTDRARPFARACAARDVDRMIDELGGLAMGLLADGRLAPEEVDFLLSWMLRHADCATVWPSSVLFERVGRMLEDGLVDGDERRELFGLLAALCGQTPGLPAFAASPPD